MTASLQDNMCCCKAANPTESENATTLATYWIKQCLTKCYCWVKARSAVCKYFTAAGTSSKLSELTAYLAFF